MCRIRLEENPSTIVLVRHDWSGCILISDGHRQLAMDCYHPHHHLEGVDLRGFGRDLSVETVGKNGLSHAAQAVVAGVLVAQHA